MFRVLAAALLTAAIPATQAAACSCLMPGELSEAEAQDILANYEVVSGNLAQFIRAPDCEAGPDRETYQTYVVTTEGGRSLQVRQAAQNFDGRCEARSSAACGTVLPESGRYFLVPLDDGSYRYPLSCDLVSANAAFEALHGSAAPGGAEGPKEPDPCG